MENIKEEDNTFLGLPLDGKAAVNFANYMMSQERFEIMSDRAKNNPELYPLGREVSVTKSNPGNSQF